MLAAPRAEAYLRHSYVRQRLLVHAQRGIQIPQTVAQRSQIGQQLRRARAFGKEQNTVPARIKSRHTHTHMHTPGRVALTTPL